jgi:hypothetical protein
MKIITILFGVLTAAMILISCNHADEKPNEKIDTPPATNINSNSVSEKTRSSYNSLFMPILIKAITNYLK